ncbi:MAG: hypothetical protein IKQ11_04730 [Paludibacteraceae bacterium]|nr:hypothetical protein [Paludibacteraceae bacterium]
MKKVLFFAAVLAVASMTFVACGKKENKEAEQECNEATEQVEAAPAADVDRAEAATQAIEAAASMEEVMAVAMEYQDLSDEDFTPEQQARMQAAVAKLQ